ncbi:two-component system, CitB family, sensor kinase [Caloramator quimbayensis]|uniref:histidine kinase n=1 Tax=Caloramator quimbayensis TaxID=1147123 RepID=A0A1T4WR89_9CLOT|nr:two-component system, CitB family, sensor kinase [Caloramator quimbayensis]
MKLQYRLTLFISSIIISIICGLGLASYHMIKNTIETQMGNNAMDLAVTIASMDDIKEALATKKDYKTVQNIVDCFCDKTRFQYIIVMDMNGIKYSYPRGKSLGKKYNDGGEERVLKYGESYVSKDKNVLISAIRAFVPIYYNGRQVGAVLVGLLTDTVYKELSAHILFFKITVVIGLIIGIVGAAILANLIKRTIFGLEPSEIALLLGQRDLILQSIKNGILAIDKDGNILFFNKVAKDILNFKDDDVGKNIKDMHLKYADEMMKALIYKDAIYNQEIKLCHDITLICSHTLLRNHKDEIIGVVSIFEDLTDVKKMAEELTGIKKMTSALRAQNHEFMNKLHTISGLIQLEEYEKALEYISNVSYQRRAVSEVLNNQIKNPHIAGLLLAKYNKAVEAKISLVIDKESNLEEIPQSITVDDLCSVIGNLIENSIEELVKQENGKIIVKLNSNKDGLRIRIEDNGPGIDEKIADKIFIRGFTTKPGNRGIGLSIVKQIIDYAKGSINVIQDNGVIWDIFIPMKGI